MKRMKKIFAVVLGVSMLVGVTASAAVSNSGSQDGIQAFIQTNKNSYAANEDIQVNITVTNTNGHTVKNVSIEGLLPDDLTLKDGSLQSDTVNLDAGETLTLDCVAVLEKEIVTDPETTTTETTEPDTTEPATEPPTEPESSTELPTESEPVVTEPIEPTTETTEPEETETDTTLPETTTEETTTSESTTEEPTDIEPSTVPDTTIPDTEEPSTGEESTDGGIILPVEPSTDRNSPSTTQPDSSTENTPDNPNTGDSSAAIKVLACLAVAGAVVVAIVVIQKKNSKKATRVISLVLCGAIAISGIATTGFLSVSAEEDNSRSFTVQTVVTVDGGDYTLEGKVNYEVSATEEGDVKLYSDPKELSTSDAPQDVLFYIDTESTTGTCDVALFNAENGKKLAGMQDNGKNGDKIAGDGIYSTTISVDCSEETTMQYYAIVDDEITKVKSKALEIDILAPMTDEEAENMEIVDNRLLNLTESSDYINASFDAKVDLLKEEFESMLAQKLILDYEFDRDNDIFVYHYRLGATGLWEIERISDDDLLNAGYDDEWVAPTSKNISRNRNLVSTKNPGKYGRALILYGLDNPQNKGSWFNSFQELQNGMAEWGLSTDMLNNPTVNSYKTALTNKDYNVIIIEEHGAKWKGDYIIGTRENTSSQKNKQYSNDLTCKSPRVIRHDGEYALTPEFFSFYYKEQLQNVIVYMGSCMGMGKGNDMDYSFSSAFLEDCSAANFLGFHNSVYNKYQFEILKYLIYGLTEERKNIGESISSSLEILGYDDIKYARAHTDWSDKEITQKEKRDGAASLEWTGSSKTVLNIVGGPDISFEGGDGSINNPYQIATAGQLDAVRYHLDSNFVLVDDIDLSEYENWEPIGGYIDVEPGDGLQGSFDGQGHTISNLKMNYTITPTGDSHPDYYFGLFSDTTLSPGIKNINLENVDVNISGKTDVIPGVGSSKIYIAGLSAVSSAITDVFVSGKFNILLQSDLVRIGSIAGTAKQVTNATNKADVYAHISGLTSLYSTSCTAHVGGVISDTDFSGANLDNCTNYGNIKLVAHACWGSTSGIIAESRDGATISNCKNYGLISGESVEGETLSIAGIGAYGWESTYTKCINYGDVSAKNYDNISYTSGIVADMASSIGDSSIINCCVNFGNIENITISTSDYGSSGYCGGIVARSNYAHIEQCYNLAYSLNLICKTPAQEIKGDASRISGSNALSITNSYSVESTLLNGVPAAEDIGPDQKNGGSMARAEIEKAVTDLGFELPGQAQYIVWQGIPQTVLSTQK